MISYPISYEGNRFVYTIGKYKENHVLFGLIDSDEDYEIRAPLTKKEVETLIAKLTIVKDNLP